MHILSLYQVCFCRKFLLQRFIFRQSDKKTKQILSEKLTQVVLQSSKSWIWLQSDPRMMSPPKRYIHKKQSFQNRSVPAFKISFNRYTREGAGEWLSTITTCNANGVERDNILWPKRFWLHKKNHIHQVTSLLSALNCFLEAVLFAGGRLFPAEGIKPNITKQNSSAAGD